MTSYDKSSIYEEQIKPLLQQIHDICMDAHIPYFTTFAVCNTETETKYQHSIKTPRALNIDLFKNTIVEHSKLENSFSAIKVVDVDEMVINIDNVADYDSTTANSGEALYEFSDECVISED